MKMGDFYIMLAIGSDHGGINLKEAIKKHLSDKGIEVKDFGTYDQNSCDYPDIAIKVANEVALKNAECGILVCGTGIGMSMAANKVKGIRAAHVTDTFSARMTKEHNDANIICLGERITGVGLALDIVDAYLDAKFQGGRHSLRIEKVMAIEK